ncbi:MAG: hypothetical protein NTX59_00030 [Elusimicrobia bacterium]|nr:hypothetical protein [Elusimicrobiota bacterium]
MILLKNPLRLKINFEKDHRGSLTGGQKPFARGPGEKFLSDFRAIFKTGGFSAESITMDIGAGKSRSCYCAAAPPARESAPDFAVLILRREP